MKNQQKMLTQRAITEATIKTNKKYISNIK